MAGSDSGLYRLRILYDSGLYRLRILYIDGAVGNAGFGGPTRT